TWGGTTKAPPLVEEGPYSAPPSSCLDSSSAKSTASDFLPFLATGFSAATGSSDASKIHNPYPLWPRRKAATFGSSVANSPLTNSTRGPSGCALITKPNRGLWKTYRLRFAKTIPPKKEGGALSAPPYYAALCSTAWTFSNRTAKPTSVMYSSRQPSSSGSWMLVLSVVSRPFSGRYSM